MQSADRRSLTTLAVGHAFADVSQSFVPAMLPFVIVEQHLSYAAAAMLVLAGSVSSSVVQPLFGHTSDRLSLPWLMPIGVAIAGLGIALAGTAPSYALLFAAIVLSGLGVAAFHPEGSRFASHVSGARRASGMSIFSLGGNIGFALGPIVATPLLIAYGLRGTLLMLLPTIAIALILARAIPRLQQFDPMKRAAKGAQPAPPPGQWGPFWRVLAVIVLRTMAYFSLLTFVPLYYIGVLHATKTQANLALAAMLIAGAVGTLIGGRVADAIGKRIVIIAAMLALVPLLWAFPRLPAPLATVVLILIGIGLICQSGVSVVMGQEYLPGRLGVASGLTLGFGIGIGGFAVPILGLIADRYGLGAALQTIVIIPVLGTLLALTLPVDSRSIQAAGEESVRVRYEDVSTQKLYL